MSSNLNVLKPLYTSFAYHPGSLRRYMLAVILAMVGSFGVFAICHLQNQDEAPDRRRSGQKRRKFKKRKNALYLFTS